MRDEAAAEPREDAREDAPDQAGADDADGLAVEVEAEQAMELEIALADPVVGAVGLAVQGQDQRDRVLGDGVGRIGRHPADGEARRGGRRDVDVVEAGRAEGEQADAEGGEARDDRRREVVVDEGANRPGLGREGGGLGGEAGLVEDERVARGSVRGGQRGHVVGTGGGDGDLHRASRRTAEPWAGAAAGVNAGVVDLGSRYGLPPAGLRRGGGRC